MDSSVSNNPSVVAAECAIPSHAVGETCMEFLGDRLEVFVQLDQHHASERVSGTGAFASHRGFSRLARNMANSVIPKAPSTMTDKPRTRPVTALMICVSVQKNTV